MMPSVVPKLLFLTIKMTEVEVLARDVVLASDKMFQVPPVPSPWARTMKFDPSGWAVAQVIW